MGKWVVENVCAGYFFHLNKFSHLKIVEHMVMGYLDDSHAYMIKSDIFSHMYVSLWFVFVCAQRYLNCPRRMQYRENGWILKFQIRFTDITEIIQTAYPVYGIFAL